MLTIAERVTEIEIILILNAFLLFKTNFVLPSRCKNIYLLQNQTQSSCLLFQWVGIFNHQFNNKQGPKFYFEALSFIHGFLWKNSPFQSSILGSKELNKLLKFLLKLINQLAGTILEQSPAFLCSIFKTPTCSQGQEQSRRSNLAQNRYANVGCTGSLSHLLEGHLHLLKQNRLYWDAD